MSRRELGEYSRDYLSGRRVIAVRRTRRRVRKEYISRKLSSRWCLPARAWMRGFSRFIAPGWLQMSCLRATGMQLNARRRWRGKKHVPDSQNRGAVTRRCCGARRPIDHQSLPSRMRRSLPHDFGVPTPKRVPYIIVYTISLRLALSLLSPCRASRHLRSSFFSPPILALPLSFAPCARPGSCLASGQRCP